MRLSSKDPIIFKSNKNEADNFTEEKQFMEHKTEDTKNAYCASETFSLIRYCSKWHIVFECTFIRSYFNEYAFLHKIKDLKYVLYLLN